jgi:hypothetical protein
MQLVKRTGDQKDPRRLGGQQTREVKSRSGAKRIKKTASEKRLARDYKPEAKALSEELQAAANRRAVSEIPQAAMAGNY